jgi:hypothetical protein
MPNFYEYDEQFFADAEFAEEIDYRRAIADANNSTDTEREAAVDFLSRYAEVAI